jgi:hypothetical protein
MAELKRTSFDFAAKEVSIEFANPEAKRRLSTDPTAVESIEYSASNEREVRHGGSRLPQLRSDGQWSFSGSLTAYRYYFQYICEEAREAGVPLMRLELTIGVTFFDEGGQSLFTDTLTRVALDGIENSMSEGSELIMVTMPLNPFNIFFQGEDIEGNKLGTGAPTGGGSGGIGRGGSPGIGGQLIFP